MVHERLWTAQVILNILRNRAYVGEVYWRGDWFRSAEPFIDPAVFARVEALLDQRGDNYGKRSATRRPEYLLTSLIKCGRCSRNYVGVASHGKKNRYRYYMCWTRSRYGATACSAERIRADELEAAVFDALLSVYSDPAILRGATAEHADAERADAAQRADALGRIETELRKAEAAIERYMLAFEDGKLSAEVFSERVEQLGTTAQELRQRRSELEAAATTLTPEDLSDDVLEEILADLSSAASDAPESVRKALAQAFVHELRVQDRRTVHPTFRVLPRVPVDGTPAGESHYRCAYTDKQGGR